MSSGTFKMLSTKYVYKLYIVYNNKEDLAFNNQQ